MLYIVFGDIYISYGSKTELMNPLKLDQKLEIDLNILRMHRLIFGVPCFSLKRPDQPASLGGTCRGKMEKGKQTVRTYQICGTPGGYPLTLEYTIFKKKPLTLYFLNCTGFQTKL